MTCIVVDDASDEDCAKAIDKLDAENPQVELVRHPQNRGKGGAVKSGLLRAGALGFSHAIQLDADEQHDLANLDQMIEQSSNRPAAVILGVPVYDEHVPVGRYYGRYVSRVWVWINTLSLEIPDAMCGFRIYPVQAALELLRNTNLGERMEFDIEILVRLSWRGVRFQSVPVHVYYHEGNPSHFHYLLDNLRISMIHARLFLGMLIRLPQLLAKRIGRGTA